MQNSEKEEIYQQYILFKSSLIKGLDSYVLKGRIFKSSAAIVIKIVSKIFKKARVSLQNEEEIFNLLKEQNGVTEAIVPILSSGSEEDSFNNLLDTRGPYLYIIFKNQGINLYEHISSNRESILKSSSWEEHIKLVFTGIVKALNFLHKHNVAHRDIKLENILIDPESMEVRLCDLGLSMKLEEGKNEINDSDGTDSYKAPEIWDAIINPKKKFDPIIADLFALGVVLFEIIFFKSPFQMAKSTDLTYKTFRSSDFSSKYSSNSYGESFNPSVIDLLIRLLNHVPSERPVTEKIMKHPWLAG
jgi:serine/threonine-protein kinase HSL1, negative regulator of Swe1 kinase